ncbi:MAG: hypothetical protein ACKO85_10160 [Isosphaeraceae bacterium]
MASFNFAKHLPQQVASSRFLRIALVQKIPDSAHFTQADFSRINAVQIAFLLNRIIHN